MGYSCFTGELCVARSSDGRVWEAANDGYPVFGRATDTVPVANSSNDPVPLRYGLKAPSPPKPWPLAYVHNRKPSNEALQTTRIAVLALLGASRW